MPRTAPSDLLLDLDPAPAAIDGSRMRLLDAPKVERPEDRHDFDWKPTLALVALGGIALAVALVL